MHLAQSCQIFLGTTYQIGKKCTKRPKKLPNGHKIYHGIWPQNRPNGHKIYQHLQLQDPQKFTQIGILGLKIYHLATLILPAIR
jgi:hypothetical protein